MNQHGQASMQTPQQTYVPAVAVGRITLRHSLYRVPVATYDTPEHTCGIAQRVGYTGKLENDLAFYRLKIKTGNNLPTLMLPGFFVLEQGIFINYEQWCANQKAKKEGE